MRFREPKCVWCPGSARTHWGSFSAPPDLLAAVVGGVLLLRGMEGREKEEEGKGRGRKRKGGGGKRGLPLI